MITFAEKFKQCAIAVDAVHLETPSGSPDREKLMNMAIPMNIRMVIIIMINYTVMTMIMHMITITTMAGKYFWRWISWEKTTSWRSGTGDILKEKTYWQSIW